MSAPDEDPKNAPVARKLPPAAERALSEAAARRMMSDRAAARPREVAGPKGPDPARYGDWAVKGIASDFS